MKKFLFVALALVTASVAVEVSAQDNPLTDFINKKYCSSEPQA